MRLTLKRILQAFFLAVLFSFSTLAMLRTWAATSNNSTTAIERISQEKEESPWIKNFVGLWPDRSLRSVLDEEGNTLAGPIIDDNDVFEGITTTTTSSTTTTKPHTTLDDIFISVKTTKNFHASRLDVIIKTWFTLAREQVSILNYFLWFYRSAVWLESCASVHYCPWPIMSMRCFPYYLSAFVSQKRILIKIWLLTKGPVNWFFKRNEKEIPELTNIFLSIHTEIESDDWWITREGWTRESYFGSVILCVVL